jgi:hypothetical protein
MIANDKAQKQLLDQTSSKRGELRFRRCDEIGDSQPPLPHGRGFHERACPCQPSISRFFLPCAAGYRCGGKVGILLSDFHFSTALTSSALLLSFVSEGLFVVHSHPSLPLPPLFEFVAADFRLAAPRSCFLSWPIPSRPCRPASIRTLVKRSASVPVGFLVSVGAAFSVTICRLPSCGR